MKPTRFATQWSRSARLGLALVAFVGPVHAFAQFPAHYTARRPWAGGPVDVGRPAI